MMSYKKAADVLPEELIDLIQNYVDGEYLYIPRKEGNCLSHFESCRIFNVRYLHFTVFPEAFFYGIYFLLFFLALHVISKP